MDSNKNNMYDDKIYMRSLLYLEFLFKKFPEELVKIREYLPEELFVDFEITIDHFDRELIDIIHMNLIKNIAL